MKTHFTCRQQHFGSGELFTSLVQHPNCSDHWHLPRWPPRLHFLPLCKNHYFQMLLCKFMPLLMPLVSWQQLCWDSKCIFVCLPLSHLFASLRFFILSPSPFFHPPSRLSCASLCACMTLGSIFSPSVSWFLGNRVLQRLAKTHSEETEQSAQSVLSRTIIVHIWLWVLQAHSGNKQASLKTVPVKDCTPSDSGGGSFDVMSVNHRSLQCWKVKQMTLCKQSERALINKYKI